MPLERPDTPDYRPDIKMPNKQVFVGAVVTLLGGFGTGAVVGLLLKQSKNIER